MPARPFLPRLPDSLADALVSEWRSLTGSKGSGPLSSAELDRAARALLDLQRGLTGDRGLVGAAYMESVEALGAYLLYYWPASFLQAGHALDECGLPKRGTVLDLGAGPGPASAACALRGAASVTAVDKSPRALAVAKRVLGTMPVDFSTRERRADAADISEGAWDLIILSHSLNEFFYEPGLRPRSRAAFIESLSLSLNPGGCVLVLEPALLSTSRGLIGTRDDLVSRGWKVAAPCIFEGPCPAYAAGEGQTCHDSFEWSPPAFTKAIAERAGLDRAELKMAWFALYPPGAGTGIDALGGGEFIVVSDPMLNKAGRTRYMVCGASGRSSLSAKLSGLPSGCAAFARLRRGMRIRLSGLEERGGGGAGLREGSVLEIIG